MQLPEELLSPDRILRISLCVDSINHRGYSQKYYEIPFEPMSKDLSLGSSAYFWNTAIKAKMPKHTADKILAIGLFSPL